MGDVWVFGRATCKQCPRSQHSARSGTAKQRRGKQRKDDSHDVNNIVAVTRFVVLDEW